MENIFRSSENDDTHQQQPFSELHSPSQSDSIKINYVTPGFKSFSILPTFDLLWKEGVENDNSDQNDNLESTCRLVWWISVVVGYWTGQLSVFCCSVELVCSAYLLGLAPMNLAQ